MYVVGRPFELYITGVARLWGQTEPVERGAEPLGLHLWQVLMIVCPRGSLRVEKVVNVERTVMTKRRDGGHGVSMRQCMEDDKQNGCL